MLIPHEGENDLRQALLKGYTLQFYGIQMWLPGVASLAAQLTRKTVGRPGEQRGVNQSACWI